MKQDKQTPPDEELEWEFTCDRCGKHNQCSYAEGKSNCWCMYESRSVDYGMYDPNRCLCPTCFKELQEAAE